MLELFIPILVVLQGLAVAAGLPLDDQWGAFGEFAGIIATDGDESPMFANVGVTYEFAQWFVMDTGFLIGLNGDAEDLVYRMGFTMNFGGTSVHDPGH